LVGKTWGARSEVKETGLSRFRVLLRPNQALVKEISGIITSAEGRRGDPEGALMSMALAGTNLLKLDYPGR
jgi:hypothetical protein